VLEGFISTKLTELYSKAAKETEKKEQLLMISLCGKKDNMK